MALLYAAGCQAGDNGISLHTGNCSRSGLCKALNDEKIASVIA